MKKILSIAAFFTLLASQIIYADRNAPKYIPPIIYKGVKYSVLHSGPPPYNRSGGYIEARDSATDRLLWGLFIYTTWFLPLLERDVQEIYIKSMILDKRNNRLIITNEKNRVFFVDLKTRKVTSR